ncbi:hybrid sensor histidine kinase/response regulator transcription factor [Algoriphagus chordae]|uniref:hybrid sensor histidine kinase/response regulator transcription factor n=1 Tax=Algoriphagus chordae TaxID=237019 RepID=UPI0011B7A1BF|nr:two-component regulator propeller domain-containing protein [Algoriphagus chordae]
MLTKKTIILVFYFVLFSAKTIIGQTEAINQITTEHGLLNNYITCIYQDESGFIWIGTKEGASRFDGTDYIHFTHNPADSLSLSSSTVLDIIQDKQGNIWIATNEGLNFLEKDQDIIQQIHFPSKQPKGNFISKLFIDNSDKLWVGTGSGELYLYKSENEGFENFTKEGMAEIRDIIQLDNQSLLLGYGDWVLRNKKGGVSLFDIKTKNYHAIENPSIPSDLSITKLLKHQTRIFFSTYNKGVFEWDQQQGKLERIDSENYSTDLIYDIISTPEGQVWLATDGKGILQLDLSTGEISPIPGNKSLNSKAITSLLYDSNNITWVGTVNGGVNKIDPHKSKIDHWGYTNDPSSGLSGKSVLSLSKSKRGGIWIGMDHGSINYFDPTSSQFQYHISSSSMSTPADAVILGLMEDSKENLWIGYYLKGLGRLKNQTNIFEHHLDEKWLYGATYLKSFYEDSDGTIWLGSRNQGLIKVNQELNKSQNYKHDPGDAKSLPHNHVSVIIEKDKDHLWVGTFNGLSLFDKKSGTFEKLPNDPTNPNSLQGKAVYSICKDLSGNLWIATDKALNYLDLSTDQFTQFNVSHGLPSNTIKGVILDDYQELWVSTNQGISHFSPTTKKFTNYGFQDGVIGIEFNENAALKDDSGKLYFGSVDGITSFHPKEIKKNKVPPHIYLSRLSIENEPIKTGDYTDILTKSLNETKAITLNYNQADFTIEFIALNYTSPEKNQYAYQLVGFDNTWRAIGNERKAIYTNIDPGEYTFTVKAANNDGLWNETPRTLTITILPPWWKTWWAYTLYMSMILLAIYGISRASLNRMRLRNDLKFERIEKQQQEALSKMKINFFTNISHEFKTPLTLISGPAQSLGQLQKLPQESKYFIKLIQANAKRLQVLVEQLMDFRKAEEGEVALHKMEIELVGFLNGCLDNFSFLADQQEISVSKNYDADCLFIDVDKNKLDIVLYNLLSNAFKFTEKGGAIVVGLTILEDEIKIFVEDNGIGISPNELQYIFEPFYQSSHNLPGTGIGLPLSKTYMQLHGGRIEASSKQNEGSNFSLFFPFDSSQGKYSPVLETKLAKQKVQHRIKSTDLLELASEAEKVLIIEDDLQMQSYILACFKPLYHTKVANDGAIGKEIADEWQPDLIICDVMMPNMDGITLVKLLKANFMTSHIPIILLTAKADENDIQEGLRFGADDYIPKPFNPNILITKVQNIISIRKNLQEIYRSSTSKAPEKLDLNQMDKDFLKNINQALFENYRDPEFNINQLAENLGLSRSQLFRKIKGLSGQTPHYYLQIFRLDQSRELLLNSGLNISEVAYELGFGTVKNFRIAFKKHYGCTPRDYINLHS